MSADSSSDGPSRSRIRRLPLIGGAVVALAVVALVIGLSLRGSGTPEAAGTGSTPSASAIPTVEPSPAVTSAPGTIDDDTAVEVLTSYLDIAATIPPATEDVEAAVGSIAGDGILEELEAQLAELDDNGWSITGVPEIVSSEIVDEDLAASPPTATLQVCLDSSGVTTLDSAGEPIGDPSDSARALHLYTLAQQSDGSWVLTGHSFPDDPAC